MTTHRLPTDPIERCKLLEAQVADLTKRVEALETGRNLTQEPRFDEGTREDGKPDRERERTDERRLRSLQMLGDAGRQQFTS